MSMKTESEKIEEERWRRYVFPYIHSNMYIWRCDKPGKAIVVDPNISEMALQYLDSFGAKDILIILTHEHFDHTSGVNWLCERYTCKVICHELCAKAIAVIRNNRPLSIAMLVNNSEKKDEIKQFVKKIPLYTCKTDITFPGNYKMDWFGEDIEFQYCPGHSKGSVCVRLNRQFIFTGDSLIPNIPVITRYPSGNMDEYEKITLPYLKQIDDNAWIMPGHGEPIRMRELEFSGEKFIYREN